MSLSELARKILSFIADLFEVVVLASALFVLVYLFIAQPHQVTGPSMLPSFQDKEYLLTNKLAYRFGEPARGDVVIFRYPVRPEIDYIKRIIALPGEELMVKDGKVIIYNGEHSDGFILPENYIVPGSNTTPHAYTLEGERVRVREGEYLVFGDNRAHSSDSREWGPVPAKNIIGPAWLRYWPPNVFGILNGVSY